MTILDKFLLKFDNLLDGQKGGKGSGNWGHVGRPGKRGGSSKRILGGIVRNTSIINPSSVEELGSQVKNNLQELEKKRKVFFESSNLPYKERPIEKMDSRVPGILYGNDIIAHNTSGAHRDMSPKGAGNFWEDDKIRFGLVFDKNFKKVNEVQLVQGAMGVDFKNPRYQDLSLKRAYKVIDKLSKIKGMKGTKVSLELEELDRNGYPVIVNTVV